MSTRLLASHPASGSEMLTGQREETRARLIACTGDLQQFALKEKEKRQVRRVVLKLSSRNGSPLLLHNRCQGRTDPDRCSGWTHWTQTRTPACR